MKKVIAISLLFLSSFAFAGIATQPAPLSLDQCRAQLPYGTPKANPAGWGMCRNAYATVNDLQARLPIWVAYVLRPENAIGCLPRSNNFAADQSIPKGQRAEEKDYAHSGFDIGHMAPSADMSWNAQAEAESFFLSNMAPQLPGLNRGIWKLLESNVRAWAHQRQHSLLVYVGPVYLPITDTIGPSRVVVPHAFYKIIVDTHTNETLAFIFPHHNALGKDLAQYQTTVKEIERQTGIVFPLPAQTEEKTNIFSADLGQFIQDKRAKCGTKGTK